MQDAFTAQKGHIKCTVAQKEMQSPPFLVLIFIKLYEQILNIYLTKKN